MGDDAQRQSQAAQITPRTEELRELAARVAELEAEQRRQNRIAELLSTAGDPRFPPLARKPRRPKRDRHGLYIVRGLGVAAAWAGASLLRHPVARRVLAGAVIAGVGTAGALTPDMMQPAPASPVPAVHPHPVAHHRHRTAPALMPPGLPPRRKRRRQDRAGATPSASVAPSPPVSPSPSPVPDPVPSPLPSVSVPPVPTPAPTCTLLHGNHCHGDVAGDVVGVPGALRGLPPLS